MRWTKNTSGTTYHLYNEENLMEQTAIFITFWNDTKRWEIRLSDGSWEYLSKERVNWILFHPNEFWMSELL